MRATLLTSLAISAFAHPVWCQTITTEDELAVHANFSPVTSTGASNGTLTFRDGMAGTFTQRSQTMPGFTNPATNAPGTQNLLARQFTEWDFPVTYAFTVLNVDSTNLSFYQSLYGPGVSSVAVTDSYFIFGGINTELYGTPKISFRFTDDTGAVIPAANLDITFEGDLAGISATPLTGGQYDWDFTFANMNPDSTGNMIVRNTAGLIAGASLRNFDRGDGDLNNAGVDQMNVSFGRQVEITSSPVPEPSSMVLGAAGLLVLMRRRR